MKFSWRNSLTLLLLGVYLAVIMFGHVFHNHAVGHRQQCECVCHVACGDHHHSSGDSTPDDSAPGQSRWCGSESIEAVQACPVCSFFSHHGVPVDAATVETTGRVPERLAPISCLVEIDLYRVAHQPRAPPQSV